MQDDLTPRELQVLTLLAEGKSSKEIAFELGMSFKTACCHRWRILNKFEVHNTAELIRVAVQKGVVDLAPEQRTTQTLAGERETPRLLSQLDAILQENLRYRRKLQEALTTSQAACEQATHYREQLEMTVRGTKELTAALKQASRRQGTAA